MSMVEPKNFNKLLRRNRLGKKMCNLVDISFRINSKFKGIMFKKDVSMHGKTACIYVPKYLAGKEYMVIMVPIDHESLKLDTGDMKL